MGTGEERLHAQPRILVIGIGNAYRSDDGVGLYITRCLQGEGEDEVVIHQASSDGTALMEAWKDADTVILVDAVRSGGTPGTVYRFDVHETALPVEVFRYSTHAFSVADAVALARALHQLPPRLVVYGIEGENFAVGEGLSPAVETAVSHVVTQVRQEIATARATVKVYHA